MKVSFDYSKLRGKMAEQDLRLKDVCDIVGISKPALSMKMRGLSEFKASEMVQLADLLKIDTADIPVYFLNRKL